MVVTGGYSAVINSYAEVLRASAGSRLIGLLPYRRPSAEQVFDAVKDDNGLSEEQAQLLHDAYVLEGRVEHSSPDVDAEEVRVMVLRLREAIPDLISTTHAWLKQHGIEIK